MNEWLEGHTYQETITYGSVVKYKTGQWAKLRSVYKKKKEKSLRVARRWHVLMELQTALVLARVVSTGCHVCLDAKICAGRCRFKFKCSEKLAVFC